MAQSLFRDTKNHGPRQVHAVDEYVYDSVDGLKTIIPYSPSWNTLLVQASGGLDSSLLLYLTARAFKEMNLSVKILPLSLEIPTKAKNLSSARAIIKKVQELVGYEHLLPGHEVIMPLDKCEPPHKNQFFNDVVVKTFENGVNFEFNGNTLNPPEEARKHFPNDDLREIERDNRTTVYNAVVSASPHAFNNKKGIVYLYKKFGILEDLASLTLSCDMDLSEVKRRKLDIPCGHCWWCHERAWGFSANDTEDPSLVDK